MERLAADLTRMVLGFAFQVTLLILGCAIRLFYWSVRRYGWGRVGGCLGALCLSLWAYTRLRGWTWDSPMLFGVAGGTALIWAGGTRLWVAADARGWLISAAPRVRLDAGGRNPGLPVLQRAGPPLPTAALARVTWGTAPSAPLTGGALWDELIRPDTLRRAWDRVASRRGAPGVDHVTVEAFGLDSDRHLATLQRELATGSYRPQSPRWAEVPKASGGVRRLAILPVRDRVVHHAPHQVLAPRWDARFSPCSFAYRPGRSVLQAVEAYADDFVVLCATQGQAAAALQTAGGLLAAMELKLHPSKTRLLHRDDGFTFLGYQFSATGKQPVEKHGDGAGLPPGWSADEWALDASAVPPGPPAPPPVPPLPPEAAPGSPPEPSADDLAIYRARFLGREDLFARHWHKENTRRGYLPVRRAPADSDLLCHLRGEVVLGSYLLIPPGHTRALALDVDGPTLDEDSRQQAQGLAVEVCEALARYGLQPLMADSGGKGRHLWLCFTTPVLASAARRWADTVLDAVRPFPEGVMVEVFPKQDYLGASALGAVLRLPLGRHPVTGRPGRFLDSDGRPILDPWPLLRTHPLIDGAALGLPAFAATVQPQALPEPPAAIAPMVRGCALLWALVEKGGRLRHLRHTERLALLYTLGHAGDAGRAYLHQVIALCSDYDARDTDGWLQRLDDGHRPMGCARLQEWLKDHLPGIACPCPHGRARGTPLDLLRLARRARHPSPSPGAAGPNTALPLAGAASHPPLMESSDPAAFGPGASDPAAAEPSLPVEPDQPSDDVQHADPDAAWAGIVADLFEPTVSPPTAGGQSPVAGASP